MTKQRIFLLGVLSGTLLAACMYGVAYENARIDRIESFLISVSR